MRILAITAAICAFVLSILFLYAGVDKDITVQQAIFCAVMMAAALICASNIEK